MTKYYSKLKGAIIKILREINTARLHKGIPSLIDRKETIRKIMVLYHFILRKKCKMKYKRRFKELLLNKKIEKLREKNLMKKRGKWNDKKSLCKKYLKIETSLIPYKYSNIILLTRLLPFICIVRDKLKEIKKERERIIEKNGYVFIYNEKTKRYNRVTKKDFDKDDIKRFGEAKEEQAVKRKRAKQKKNSDKEEIFNNEIKDYPEELRMLMLQGNDFKFK